MKYNTKLSLISRNTRNMLIDDNIFVKIIFDEDFYDNIILSPLEKRNSMGKFISIYFI